MTDYSVVGWTFERANDGRSFTFLGGRDAHIFDLAPVRSLVLNAIAWSSGLPVPAGGVRTIADPRLTARLIKPDLDEPPFREAVVTREADNDVLELDWGLSTGMCPVRWAIRYSDNRGRRWRSARLTVAIFIQIPTKSCTWSVDVSVTPWTM